MTGPLEGVVVADFTQLVQGPFATQILGDLGADVIKIEPPAGDWLRHFALGNLYPGGQSVSFLSFNRHKRSIVVDLKRPRGLEVARRIVAGADVLVENFRPGVMDRLGLGYDALADAHPRLVYCASCGFGQQGPYRDRPGQDLLVQGVSGLATLNGASDDPPIPVGVGIADLVASQHIVYGILAALYERARTDRGQRVDVNLLNSVLVLMMQEMTTFLNGGGSPERSATGIPPYLGAPYGVYRTADGFIAIAMTPVNQLARLTGVPGYEGYDSSSVLEDRDRIREDFARVFAGKPTAEWLQVLLAEDVWCAPVQTVEEAVQDPQVAANGMLVEYDHPDAGRIRTLGIPVQFGNVQRHIDRPPPRLGEHTDEILREVAGYAPEQIDELRALGAVA